MAINLENFLIKKGLNSPRNLHPLRKYFVTDLTDRFVAVSKMFLEDNLDGEIIKVEIS